jgi:hypothetical protein
MKSIFSLISTVALAAAAFAAGPVSAAAGQTGAGASFTTPTYKFTQVSTGYGYDCGLTRRARIVCWGDNRSGEANAPSGHFIQVSAGGWHEPGSGAPSLACAITKGGMVICWGAANFKSPSGSFAQFSAALGAEYACGIKTGGEIVCLVPQGLYHSNPPRGKFTQVSTGGDMEDLDSGFGCALRHNGRPVCWKGEGVASDPGTAPPGSFTRVSVGYIGTPENGGGPFACGITQSRKIVCWGQVPAGLAPRGSFTQISASGDTLCGRHSDGKVVCRFGSGASVRTFSPPGSFSQVSAGARANSDVCALQIRGSVVCWNINSGEVFDTRTALNQTSASGYSGDGGASVCGLQKTGSIDCLGAADNEPYLPSGSFIQVNAWSGDGSFVCGVENAGRSFAGDQTLSARRSPPRADSPKSASARGLVVVSRSVARSPVGTSLPWVMRPHQVASLRSARAPASPAV